MNGGRLLWGFGVAIVGVQWASGGCASESEASADCRPGTETCACYANQTCNDGLSCASGMCVALPVDGDSGAGAGGTGATTSSGGTAGLGGGAAATGGTGLTLRDSGSSDLRPTDAACATLAVAVDLTPANLVIVLDRSGSMGDRDNDADPTLRWDPVTFGLLAFLADPSTTGLQASLEFFPVPGSTDMACVTSAYEAPDVPLQALDSTDAFVTAIEATSPGGGTPTLPALEGAINYASAIATDVAHAGESTAVVFITDGEPGFYDPETETVIPGCANNDIPHVAEAARAGFAAMPSIQTYVIGVGASLENVHQIAAAGGTGQATMISVGDSQVTRELLVAALMDIRERQVSCNISIPPPPPDEDLDFAHLNVEYLHPSSGELLYYSPDCSAPNSWRYDVDPTVGQPTRIIICDDTCELVRRDNLGELVVEFGCQTRSVIQ